MNTLAFFHPKNPIRHTPDIIMEAPIRRSLSCYPVISYTGTEGHFNKWVIHPATHHVLKNRWDMISLKGGENGIKDLYGQFWDMLILKAF